MSLLRKKLNKITITIILIPTRNKTKLRFFLSQLSQLFSIYRETFSTHKTKNSRNEDGLTKESHIKEVLNSRAT